MKITPLMYAISRSRAADRQVLPRMTVEEAWTRSGNDRSKSMKDRVRFFHALNKIRSMMVDVPDQQEEDSDDLIMLDTSDDERIASPSLLRERRQTTDLLGKDLEEIWKEYVELKQAPDDQEVTEVTEVDDEDVLVLPIEVDDCQQVSKVTTVETRLFLDNEDVIVIPIEISDSVLLPRKKNRLHRDSSSSDSSYGVPFEEGEIKIEDEDDDDERETQAAVVACDDRDSRRGNTEAKRETKQPVAESETLKQEEERDGDRSSRPKRGTPKIETPREVEVDSVNIDSGANKSSTKHASDDFNDAANQGTVKTRRGREESEREIRVPKTRKIREQSGSEREIRVPKTRKIREESGSEREIRVPKTRKIREESGSEREIRVLKTRKIREESGSEREIRGPKTRKIREQSGSEREICVPKTRKIREESEREREIRVPKTRKIREESGSEREIRVPKTRKIREESGSERERQRRYETGESCLTGKSLMERGRSEKEDDRGGQVKSRREAEKRERDRSGRRQRRYEIESEMENVAHLKKRLRQTSQDESLDRVRLARVDVREARTESRDRDRQLRDNTRVKQRVTRRRIVSDDESETEYNATSEVEMASTVTGSSGITGRSQQGGRRKKQEDESEREMASTVTGSSGITGRSQQGGRRKKQEDESEREMASTVTGSSGITGRSQQFQGRRKMLLKKSALTEFDFSSEASDSSCVNQTLLKMDKTTTRRQSAVEGCSKCLTGLVIKQPATRGACVTCVTRAKDQRVVMAFAKRRGLSPLKQLLAQPRVVLTKLSATFSAAPPRDSFSDHD